MNETIIRRDESPLFSTRCKLARAALEWCRDNHASVSAPENIVTALFSLGLVVKTPLLTDAEREAIAAAVAFCEPTAAPLPRSEQIVTLRALLERTK